MIDSYMARHWPRDVTTQDMADKLDRPLQFVQRNKHPRELRIVDFLNFMQALGRNPTFALKELAAALEESLAGNG